MNPISWTSKILERPMGFFMKLKLEDKLKIITMYEVGDSISSISKKFKVCESVIKRVERQYREHGIESFKAKGKNMKYSPEFK